MCGLGIAVAISSGCNLVFGIEEQPLRPPPVEDAARDAIVESEDADAPQLACTSDADCRAPNGCYTPHCDTVLGACAYALCEAKDRTCAMGVCDPATFTCSPPQPYGFRSTSYDVTGVTSGCGPNPSACVAAAFPFVFIGTRDDVVALRGDDLTGKVPIKVPISELTTKPQQIIASGRRIWVLGAVQGQAPPYQLPIAFIDVPADPTVAVLRARTKLVSYPFATAVGFAAPNGGLFLTHADATQGFATAILQAQLADGATLGLANATSADAGAFDASAPALSTGTITMYRVGGVPPGAGLVASSGSRLVLYRYPATFNLVSAAGSSAAATQPDLTLAAPLAAIGAQTFAQGPDGAVMMAVPVALDPIGDCNCTSRARLQWVFPNAIATATDANQILDPETYTNPQTLGALCNTCALGYFAPRVLATWLDRRSALTAAPGGSGPAPRMLTDVRFLGRDPFDGNPKRRARTKVTETPKGDVTIDRIALTSTNGIGYLVLADGQGNDVSLSIFDPRCDAQ